MYHQRDLAALVVLGMSAGFWGCSSGSVDSLVDSGAPDDTLSVGDDTIPIDSTMVLDSGSSDSGSVDSTASDTGPVVPISAPIDGIATYYDADGSGNCSFDKSPGAMDVAALNNEQWAGSAYCGACVDLTGPKGSVRVRIVDRCPECKTGHLDLSREAFAKIAEMSAGRVPIRWSFVPCAVTGPIAYRFKEGSNPYWTAVQIRNHRLPIDRVEADLKGARVKLVRQDYNYFVYDKGLGAGPYTLHVFASDKQELVDSIPFGEAKTFDGKAQFK